MAIDTADHAKSLEPHVAAGTRIHERSNIPGSYQLYDGRGLFIGIRYITSRSIPREARTAAARMAFADQLAGAARMADIDYENTGTVSAETIGLIRRLLSDVAAA